MALFGKNNAKTRKKKVAGESVAQESASKDTLIYRTLLRPHVTEKAHTGLAQNKYVFRVTKESTKGAVKRAIEAAYGVHVESVNIVNIPARARYFRGLQGKRSGFKKAVVTVKEGEVIEVFQGA